MIINPGVKFGAAEKEKGSSWHSWRKEAEIGYPVNSKAIRLRLMFSASFFKALRLVNSLRRRQLTGEPNTGKSIMITLIFRFITTGAATQQTD
jgi:hypothetical protein